MNNDHKSFLLFKNFQVKVKMALKEQEVDDLESWLDGLGSLREKLLQQGLKSKEELLWLSQSDIEFGYNLS